MRKERLEEADYLLTYSVWGDDRQPAILFFHGFNQSNEAVQPLLPFWKGQKVISLDLFGHGESFIKENLTKQKWQQIFFRLLQKEHIQKPHLVAFSLGGKYALSIAEKYAGYLSGLTLIAPDGIKKNAWYSIATHNVYLNRLFKEFVENPARTEKYVKIIHTLGLLPDRTYSIFQTYAGDVILRRRVYEIWMLHRYLTPVATHVIASVNRAYIPVNLVFGERDVIIPPGIGVRMKKKLRVPVRWMCFPYGHQLIRSDTVATIATLVTASQ